MDNKAQNGTKLRILQLNLNKLLTVHLELLNDSLAAHWDIILIQEPYITFSSSIRTPNCFISVTPTSRTTMESPVQSTIWVNAALSTNDWKILDILEMNDIVAIELRGGYGRLQIYSIYNAGENSNSLLTLRKYALDSQGKPVEGRGCHVLWGGDFN
ncbi:hypothetical protein L208DRAFT_1542711 [Tricholoma matsutake]|nr:hypothetical protein L208DRAFT_1542711 [Tricholoma matsutake 945]